MKYAFWPGCVSKGACPELYESMIKTSAKLGIELEELFDGNCTGARRVRMVSIPVASSFISSFI